MSDQGPNAGAPSAPGEEQLVLAALDARTKAYAPYSHFLVGAALLGEDGRIYTGCNVENVTLGLTVCAERTAVLKAVSEGCRRFELLVVCVDVSPLVAPCGLCRQALVEFGRDLDIVLVNLAGERARVSLADILPRAFYPHHLLSRD